jgi:hypothetical protein
MNRSEMKKKLVYLSRRVLAKGCRKRERQEEICVEAVRALNEAKFDLFIYSVSLCSGAFCWDHFTRGVF